MMGDEKKKNRVFERTRQCMLLLVGSLVISFTCIACVSESAENRGEQETGSTNLETESTNQETEETVIYETYPAPDIFSDDRDTFESAIHEACAVIRIRIDSSFDQYKDPKKTWFKGILENALYQDEVFLSLTKGDEHSPIIFFQTGTKEESVKGFPQFYPGEELLIFVLPGGISNPVLNPNFVMIGEFATVFDVAKGADGTVYYLDRYGVLGFSEEMLPNHLNDSALARELVSQIAEKRPDDKVFDYKYIFTEEDFRKLLADSTK